MTGGALGGSGDRVSGPSPQEAGAESGGSLGRASFLFQGEKQHYVSFDGKDSVWRKTDREGNTVGGRDAVGEPWAGPVPLGGRPSAGRGACVGRFCGLLPFSQNKQHSGQLRVGGRRCCDTGLVVVLTAAMGSRCRHCHFAEEKMGPGVTCQEGAGLGFEQGLADPKGTLGDYAGEWRSG